MIWHRRLGVGAAIILIFVAITGVVLNHGAALDLDKPKANNWFVRTLYSQTPNNPPQSFQIGRQWLTDIDGRLYVDGKDIGRLSQNAVGAVQLDRVVIVASPTDVHLYTNEFFLVEALTAAQIPGAIKRLGVTANGDILIETGSAKFRGDANLAQWEESLGEAPDVTWSVAVEPAHAVTDSALAAFGAQGVPLDRLILDLHSGRLFGGFGVFIVDLAALVMVFLSISGAIVFFKKSGQRRSDD